MSFTLSALLEDVGDDTRADGSAALGRGVAEELTDDLAHIRGVRPVEQVRVQALLGELSPPRDAYANPSTAPQIGRILGAGHLVGGTCRVRGNSVQIDLRLAQVRGRRASGETAESAVRRTGPLEDIFRLQGQAAVSVVRHMGIAVTEPETRMVTSVPTRNVDAFLEYAFGLVAEDRGRFEEAAEHYRRAHRLAPGYHEPARRTERAEGLSAAAGPRRSALRAVDQFTSSRPRFDDRPTGDASP